jgi:ERCC4-type nuclease
MSIIITPNEVSLIEVFKDKNIDYTTENLLVGDVHIKYNDEIIYIIERKAKADLDASIKDGRYKEQKNRLMETGLPRKNIIYLIEQLKIGNENASSRIWSAICNSQHRDGFSVFQTKDIYETVLYITGLANSIKKFGFEKIDTPVNVNIKKKSVTTDWYLYSLTLIPKCSVSIAKVITNEYSTMKSLITAIEEKGDCCLAELRHGASERRIGNKLSQEICKMIYNEFL